MSDVREPNVEPDVGGPNGPVGPEQLVYQPYDAANWFSVGFPGMKSTSMEDQVDTWAAGGVVPFGVVVTSSVANQVVAGGATNPKGISVHDHVNATFGGYLQYTAVSVMTRGRLWCLVDGAGTGIAEGVAANYNTTTGAVTAAAVAAGIAAIPHASFRGTMKQYYNWMNGTTTNIAEVELHYPMAA